MDRLTSPHLIGLAFTVLFSVIVGHYGSYLLFAVLLTGIFMYYGFFDRFEWYKNVKSKSTARLEKVNSYVLLVEELVDNILKNISVGGKTIIKSGTINVEYNSNNGSSNIMLPFSTLNKTKMGNIDVFLIRVNEDSGIEEEIKITQQPGIPYSFSPQQLNGKLIRAVNKNTGVVKEYENIPPGYLTELHETE